MASLSSLPGAGQLDPTTPLLQRRGTVPYSSPYNHKKRSKYFKPRFYLGLVRRGIGELLSTALFVFVTVAAYSSVSEDGWSETSVTSSAATVVALASGMAYAGLMTANGHVSGGHMNPAVTVGVFIAGGINVVAAVVYVCMQVIGGLVGAACVLAYDTNYGSNGSNDSNFVGSTVDYGLTMLHNDITPLQGIAVETVLTLMLVMVYIHSTMEGEERGSQPMEDKSITNKRVPVHSRSLIAPIACGLTVSAGIMSSFSITGGSLNPARSLGPAVVGSIPTRWQAHYVYWAGPMIGAILAGTFYRLVLSSHPVLPLTEDDTPKSNRLSSSSHR